MTSLILENADLNRLFPKCRPRLAAGSAQQQQQQQEQSSSSPPPTPLTPTCFYSSSASPQSPITLATATNDKDDMIDLERDTSDRCRKRANGRKKSSSSSRNQAVSSNNTSSGLEVVGGKQLLHVASSSSSSSASGRSEDAVHYGSDQQAQSQQDDSGPDESPVYILTNAKGDRSYKLRDSRIIEIAGGREVFSQSRGKVARKSRFLAASNSLGNEDNQSSDKLSFKKNNKSPNRQSVWELRSKCGEARKQRMQREVTETVFSSEVHSVRRNPSKSILDYDSPKSNRGRFVNYDSLLMNSNNAADHGMTGPKSITDLEYGLPKNCIDSLAYQSSNHKTPPARHVSGPPGMALVNDGEVVVFDDIDDNWQNLRLDLGSTNAPASGTTPTSTAQQRIDELLLQQQQLQQQQQQQQQQTRSPPEHLSSSLCSSPSPTTTYHRSTSDFFKMTTPGSECESDYAKTETNNHHHHHHHHHQQQHHHHHQQQPQQHKSGTTRFIGELPIAQYSGSPRRYGMRENVRLPTLLSSPSSVYVAPRPGFPQRVLPTTPTQREDEAEEESCGSEIMLDGGSSMLPNDDTTTFTNALLVTTSTSPTPSASSPLAAFASATLSSSIPEPVVASTTTVTTAKLIATSMNSLTSSDEEPVVEEEVEAEDEDEDLGRQQQQQQQQQPKPEIAMGDDEGEEAATGLEDRERSESPLKPYVLPSDNLSSLESLGGSTFDYLYEFSETRKVLEEFFKCPVAPIPSDDQQLLPTSDNCSAEIPFQDLEYELRRKSGGSSYVGQRLASVPTSEEVLVHESPKKHKAVSATTVELTSQNVAEHHENNFLDLSADTGSSEDLGETEVGLQVGHSRNFTLSPETTECDSNCGDLDSEMSLMMMDNELLPSSGLLGSIGDLGNNSDSLRIYTSMPVLEDGLSSGHASDTDNNNPTVMLMKRQINEIEKEIIQRTRNDMMLDTDSNDNAKDVGLRLQSAGSPELFITKKENSYDTTSELQLDGLDPLGTPPPPAPQSRQGVVTLNEQQHQQQGGEVEAAIKDIRMALQRTKTLPVKSPSEEPPEPSVSPIWIPRRRICTESNSEDSELRRNADDADLDAEEAADEEEADTDLETDRLLGQQRTDDQGFYDDKWAPGPRGLLQGWRKPKTRTLLPTSMSNERLKVQPTKPTSLGLNAVPEALDCNQTSPSPLKSTQQQQQQQPTTPKSSSSSSQHQQQQQNSGRPDVASISATNTSDDQQQQQLTTTDGGSPAVAVVASGASPQPKTTTSPTSPRSLKEPAVAKDKEGKKKSRNKEALLNDPSVLIEGVLFRARYLGSTQLACEGQPTKSTRMCQAEEAVSRIKDVSSPTEQDEPQQEQQQQATSSSSYAANLTPQASQDDEDECDSSEELMANEAKPLTRSPPLPPPLQQQQQQPMQQITTNTAVQFRLQFLGSVEVEEESGRKRRKRLKKHMVEEAVTKIKAPEGESQPSTEVDLFISTEKIMVLNTDLKEIMMDHALRTISYIADIGELVVLMARRRFVPHEMDEAPKNRTPKMICHVFESEEAQFIAQSIGQAFQVAYMEFLKANGIEDHSFVKEMDYQEVLNSQEIFGDELQMFAKKEMQKEVVVPKAKGEILGVVIVESGWGSMLPTVVIANLAPAGAAARCGQLNIGDQIIAINGVSLVGLPLSTCQTYIKNSKNQTVVKLTVVPCAPVVEVKIKRPDTKYQLGFSVQNGVICSLLRGGIAERGGVRVGHRIIEINNQSVVAVPHEKIVNLLATSVGEILMKTMPTSMFRLLTGQESPVYI